MTGESKVVMTKRQNQSSGGGGGGLTPVETVTCDGTETFIDFTGIDGDSFLLDYAVSGANDFLMMNVNENYDDSQYLSYSDYFGSSAGMPLNAIGDSDPPGCQGLVKIGRLPNGRVQYSGNGSYQSWTIWRPACQGSTLFQVDGITSLRVKTIYGSTFAQGSKFTLYKFDEAQSG